MSNVKSILTGVKEEIRPDAETVKEITSRVTEFSTLLKKQLAKSKVDADVFIGGSFARGTLIKKEWYDIDVFARCDLKYSDPSAAIEKAVAEVGKTLRVKIEGVHGSRDYFRAIYSQGKFVIEVIPVLRIKKPQDEKNITDLSYFHVNYVKSKVKRLEDDVRLAKQFCIAQGVYGAESYINGFSGYGLECLVIHYKGFLNMLKALVKISDKVVIDPARHYKDKQDALFRINEAKLASPIVLVDPTYKERNALAALNKESFVKFQNAAKNFLHKHSLKFFEKSENNFDELARLAIKKKAELVKVILTTDRQAGDIAGTKLKKFSAYLERELVEYFDIYKTMFNYEGSDEAEFYIVAKAKKSYTKIGPPIKMLKAVAAFKKVNKKTIVKGRKLIAVVPITFTVKKYLSDLSKESDKLKEMAITGFTLSS